MSGCDPEDRNLHELEPDLQSRILALDEPVARDDWSHVRRRARHARVQALVSSARHNQTRPLLAAAAVALVVACVAFGLLGTVGRSGGRSSAAAPLSAANGVRVDAAALDGNPIRVNWAQGRVVGVVSSGRVSSVTIRFTDGTSVKPTIIWPAMVDVGVFHYAIPVGKTVADIVANDAGGRPSRQVTWYSV